MDPLLSTTVELTIAPNGQAMAASGPLSRSSSVDSLTSATSGAAVASSASSGSSRRSSAFGAKPDRSETSSRTSIDGETSFTDDKSVGEGATEPGIAQPTVELDGFEELAAPQASLPPDSGSVSLRGQLVFRSAAAFAPPAASSGVGVRVTVAAGTSLSVEAQAAVAVAPQPFAVTSRGPSALLAYGNQLFGQVAELAGAIGQGVQIEASSPLYIAADMSGWRLSVARLSNVVYGGPLGLHVGGDLFSSQWLMSSVMAGVRRWAPLPTLRSGEPAREAIGKIAHEMGPKARAAIDWEPGYSALRELTQTIDHGAIVLSDMSMLLPPMVHTDAQTGRVLQLQPFAEAEVLHFGRDLQRDGLAVELPKIGVSLTDSSGALPALRVAFRGEGFLRLQGAESLRALLHTHNARSMAEIAGHLEVGHGPAQAGNENVAKLSAELRRGYITLSQKLDLPTGALSQALAAWATELLQGDQTKLVLGLAALRSFSVTELSLNAAQAVRAAKHAGFGDGIALHHGATDPTLAGLLVGVGGLASQALPLANLVATESSLKVSALLKPMHVRLSDSPVTSKLFASRNIEMRVDQAGEFVIESGPKLAPAAVQSGSLAARLGAALGSLARAVWGGAQWVATLLFKTLCSPFALAARLVRGPGAEAAAPGATVRFAPVIAQRWAKSLFGPRGLRLGWLADVRVRGLTLTQHGTIRPNGELRLFHVPVYSLDKNWLASRLSPVVPFGDGLAALAQVPQRAAKGHSKASASAELGDYVKLLQQLITTAEVTLAPTAGATSLSFAAADGGSPLTLSRGAVVLHASVEGDQAPAFALDAFGLRLARAYPFSGNGAADQVAVQMDVRAQFAGTAATPAPGDALQSVAVQLRAELEQVIPHGDGVDSVQRLGGYAAAFAATMDAQQTRFDFEAGVTGRRREHRSLLTQVGDNDALRWLIPRNIKTEGSFATPALIALATKATA